MLVLVLELSTETLGLDFLVCKLGSLSSMICKVL